MMSDSLNKTKAELKIMIVEATQLAEAFRPQATDNAVIPIPAILCQRVCDTLLLTCAAVENLINELDHH